MESTAVKPEVQKLASSVMDQKLSRSPGKIAMIVFGCAIAGGIVYAGLKLGSDLATTHYPTVWPYVLLGVALLPVELILHVGSNAGFAMVFALLISAILWNLGTWWLGLPASSSHTLIGSIIGVGLANQLMSANSGTTGVDWSQVTKIGESLLLSPLVGFFAA